MVSQEQAYFLKYENSWINLDIQPNLVDTKVEVDATKHLLPVLMLSPGVEEGGDVAELLLVAR